MINNACLSLLFVLAGKWGTTDRLAGQGGGHFFFFWGGGEKKGQDAYIFSPSRSNGKKLPENEDKKMLGMRRQRTAQCRTTQRTSCCFCRLSSQLLMQVKWLPPNSGQFWHSNYGMIAKPRMETLPKHFDSSLYILTFVRLVDTEALKTLFLFCTPKLSLFFSLFFFFFSNPLDHQKITQKCDRCEQAFSVEKHTRKQSIHPHRPRDTKTRKMENCPLFLLGQHVVCMNTKQCRATACDIPPDQSLENMTLWRMENIPGECLFFCRGVSRHGRGLGWGELDREDAPAARGTAALRCRALLSRPVRHCPGNRVPHRDFFAAGRSKPVQCEFALGVVTALKKIWMYNQCSRAQCEIIVWWNAPLLHCMPRLLPYLIPSLTLLHNLPLFNHHLAPNHLSSPASPLESRPEPWHPDKAPTTPCCTATIKTTSISLALVPYSETRSNVQPST